MNSLLEVRPLPVGALHADDDTECITPELCRRNLYWPGGSARLWGEPKEMPELIERPEQAALRELEELRERIRLRESAAVREPAKVPELAEAI